MKSNRFFLLLAAALLVTCIGMAAALDKWFMTWAGSRAGDFNPLRIAIGDGQKIFAGHFYRKADVYFHSGMYPSIFDNNESFKTAHIGEDAGATGSKNTGDEEKFLGRPRDIIDRFSRNFFPSRHTHLDEGGASGPAHVHAVGGANHEHSSAGQVIELADGESGEVREILPWLKITQELDPENPLTYSVAAYWLRNRMNKIPEAEALLREGLRHLPNHPVLLFELGRIYYEPFPTQQEAQRRDFARARHIWQQGVKSWHSYEANQPEPDVFILEQLLTHLAQLEQDAGDLSQSLYYWNQAAKANPEREAILQRIVEVQKQLSATGPQ